MTKKLYVVFWMYLANYSDPEVVIADTPEQAFKEKFPLYANVKNVDMHKYVIEIQNSEKFVELTNA